MIVDRNEDIGRVGFSGLLADVETTPTSPAEAPESWAPIGVSIGAVVESQRRAVEDFCLWLEDQRRAARS